MEKRVEKLINNIGQVVIGKEETIRNIIIALLCNSHVLIEDVPGVGKTRMVSALAASLDGQFNIISLTPDIMPSDIVGYSVPDTVNCGLRYENGLAFCNFLLADEINRASSKSQSALLEVMEEHQITMDGKTMKLPDPFMVLATQNHVETYGTYHLPEAQMDRFLMRVSMGYPSKEEEKNILDVSMISAKQISAVMNTSDIVNMQETVKNIRVDEKLKDYIVEIANYTRTNKNISLGISPRGSIALYNAAKAVAFINERDYVIPEDIKGIAVPVLAHRIMFSASGRANFENEIQFIEFTMNNVEVPVR